MSALQVNQTKVLPLYERSFFVDNPRSQMVVNGVGRLEDMTSKFAKEHVKYRGYTLPVFTEVELRALPSEKLLEHAKVLYRMVDIGSLYYVPLDNYEGLIGWCQAVQRQHLEPRRVDVAAQLRQPSLIGTKERLFETATRSLDNLGDKVTTRTEKDAFGDRLTTSTVKDERGDVMTTQTMKDARGDTVISIKDAFGHEMMREKIRAGYGGKKLTRTIKDTYGAPVATRIVHDETWEDNVRKAEQFAATTVPRDPLATFKSTRLRIGIGSEGRAGGTRR